MKLSFAARTDVGQSRTHNEDNFLVDKNIRLFIVADGMGGHASGEIASAIAVNSIRETLLRDRHLIEEFHAGSAEVDRRDLLALLEQAVQTACYQVFETAQRNAHQRGMGTTIALLLVANHRGFIAHVGDSRIYLVRAGQVHQITDDHSLVNELAKQGKAPTRSDVAARYKNAITRAVGIYESVEVDTLDFDLLPDDRFLLASDGLTTYLSNAKLLELIGDVHDVPDEVTDRFVNFANEQGGKDNITVVYVRMDEGRPDQDYETVKLKLATLKGLALFRYLNYQDLVKVMNLSAERAFKPGEVIFHEGDEEDCLYVIYRGSVQIRKKEVEITVLTSGSHFGDMSLIDQSPRSADAIALDEVKSIVITRRAFYDILRKNAGVAVKLLWSFLKVLTGRLRSTSDELRLIKSLYQEKAVEDAVSQHMLAASWLEPAIEPEPEPEAEMLLPATIPPPDASTEPGDVTEPPLTRDLSRSSEAALRHDTLPNISPLVASAMTVEAHRGESTSTRVTPFGDAPIATGTVPPPLPIAKPTRTREGEPPALPALALRRGEAVAEPAAPLIAIVVPTVTESQPVAQESSRPDTQPGLPSFSEIDGSPEAIELIEASEESSPSVNPDPASETPRKTATIPAALQIIGWDVPVKRGGGQ